MARARGRGWGSTLLLTVVTVPILVVAAVLLLGARRIANAHHLVDTAAANAARAASVAPSAPSATQAATQSVNSTLTGSSLVCAPLMVTVDTSDWGVEGTVAVTVRCTAQLGALSPARLGRSATVVAHAATVLDSTRHVTS